jgi:hypothetical protein
MNIGVRVLPANFQIILRRSVFAKKIFRHDVDALVGALRRKNRRDQKLESVRVIKSAMRVRVFFF